MEVTDKDVAQAEEEDPEHAHEKSMRSLELDPSIYCLTFVCLIEKVRTHKKGAKHLEKAQADELPDFVTEDDLADYFFKSTMIYCIQIVLVIFILHAAFSEQDSLRFI